MPPREPRKPFPVYRRTVKPVWGKKIPIKPDPPSLEDLLPAEEEPEPELPKLDVLPPLADGDEEG